MRLRLCRFCFGCAAVFAITGRRTVGIFDPIPERMPHFGNDSFLRLAATLTLPLLFAIFRASGVLAFRPFGKLMSGSGKRLGLLLTADLRGMDLRFW